VSTMTKKLPIRREMKNTLYLSAILIKKGMVTYSVFKQQY
jgi:hypothetical protein